MDFVLIEWTLIYLGWGCRWLDSNLFQFHLCPMEHSTLTWFHILSCYRHWICKDLHNRVCEICFWINLYHYLSLNLFHSLQSFFLFSLWGIDYLDLAGIVLLWCFWQSWCITCKKLSYYIKLLIFIYLSIVLRENSFDCFHVWHDISF